MAGALNAALLVFAIIVLQDWAFPNDAKELLFFILLIIAPAFTLFALFAPIEPKR